MSEKQKIKKITRLVLIVFACLLVGGILLLQFQINQAKNKSKKNDWVSTENTALENAAIIADVNLPKGTKVLYETSVVHDFLYDSHFMYILEIPSDSSEVFIQRLLKCNYKAISHPIIRTEENYFRKYLPDTTLNGYSLQVGIHKSALYDSDAHILHLDFQN